MIQAQLTQAESHRERAEELLAARNDGYPGLATEVLLKALVHSVLAVAYAKADQ